MCLMFAARKEHQEWDLTNQAEDITKEGYLHKDWNALILHTLPPRMVAGWWRATSLRQGWLRYLRLERERYFPTQTSLHKVCVRCHSVTHCTVRKFGIQCPHHARCRGTGNRLHSLAPGLRHWPSKTSHSTLTSKSYEVIHIAKLTRTGIAIDVGDCRILDTPTKVMQMMYAERKAVRSPQFLKDQRPEA